MASSYTTTQGDQWDLIAYRTMGSEMYMDKLIAANPLHARTVIFPAGVVLAIPVVTKSPTKLPPWKRGGGS